MGLQDSRKAEIVLARSKRTGEKYPARISHLSGDRTKSAVLALTLHYTDDTRSLACRCFKAEEHTMARPIGDEDKNLAIAMTRYMDKFGLDTCLQPEFCQYYEQQKIDWALKGVRAERFHYSRKDKSVVCRCDRPEHLSLRRVNSPEIQELCAGFFQLNTTNAECTREQWRELDVGPPECVGRQSVPNQEFAAPKTSLSNVREDSFEYDSPSMVELTKRREGRPRSSREHVWRPSSGSPTRHSAKYSGMAHPNSGLSGGEDIPNDVWRVSRPSVYLEQYRTESLVSTPLGSPVTPVRHNADIVHKTRETRPRGLESFTEAHKQSSASSARHDYASSPSSSGLGSPIMFTKTPSAALSYTVATFRPDNEIDGMESRSSEILECSALSNSSPAVAPVAALLDPKRTAELDSIPTHPWNLPHHSIALRELEGDSFGHVMELTGRRSPVQPTSFKTGSPSRRLTSLIEQPLPDPRLPSQEDFFLRHVSMRSRANPAPVGICSLCQNSYHAPNKHTIQLPCGHLVHQECLVSNFRRFDYELGNCPTCGIALCERILQDRIDTDREAIFGKKFTNLMTEERIEFLQRGEHITCWSEEEMAIAQLRLLKDYVDAHADELYRQWRQTPSEPDWRIFVVLPVVQLFKGWNLPKRMCRYFADHDTFYELVVWAELVRLMNTTRKMVKQIHGKDTPFPQLKELHRSLMLAKDRYEIEKGTWSTNRFGILECEMVAQDAFSMAMST